MGYAGSFAGGNTSGADGTATFTPVVGAAVLILVAISGNTNADPICKDNNGGSSPFGANTSYSLVGQTAFNGTGNRYSLFSRAYPMANTTSTTVTVTAGSNTAVEIVGIQWTGLNYYGRSAVLQFAIESNLAAGTPAPTFANQTSTANGIICGVANGTNPPNPPLTTAFSGSTIRQNVGQNTPTTGNIVATRDSGLAATTLTWGSASGTSFGSIAIELNGGGVGLVQAVLGSTLSLFYGGLSFCYDAVRGIWQPEVGLSTLIQPTAGARPAATILPNLNLLHTYDGVNDTLTTTGNNVLNAFGEMTFTWPSLANYQRMIFWASNTTSSGPALIRFGNDAIGCDSGLGNKMSAQATGPGTPATSDVAQNTGTTKRFIMVGDDTSKAVTMYVNRVAQTTVGNFSAGDWGAPSEWGASNSTFGSNSGSNFWGGQLGLLGFAITPAAGTFSAATITALDVALATLLGTKLDPFGRNGFFGQ